MTGDRTLALVLLLGAAAAAVWLHALGSLWGAL